MIYSMTAFARQSLQQDSAVLVWEIRSVNHRYLEPHFKLPDTVRMLEPELRETLRSAVSRGKIECNLHLQTTAPAGASKLVINQSLLQQLLTAGEAVQQQLQQPAAINPFDALNWPGVITEIHDGSNCVNKQILALFNTALKRLIETREREGAGLKAYIEQRLTTITRITTAVRQQLPLILQAQRQKLQEKLQELTVQLNTERLEQEIVILVQKADVDEELDRLDTHVNEVHRILDKGGVCGRRLDFLMQELNREANTLSSKSIVSDTTQAAVELKVLIEQMREQIQNIE